MTSAFNASCIITCHNYEKYVGDAIRSALSQQVPFSEVVIIDDASTDRSVDVIHSAIRGHSNCRLLKRLENGGQLRAFEDGVAATSGEWVFFLDADDYFAVDWIAAARSVLSESPMADFIFSRPKMVDDKAVHPNALWEGMPRPAIWRDLGYTVIKTHAYYRFIGAPTSGLCVSRRLLNQLFPARWHDDFRTRADDWLVFGASLLGARKAFIEGEYVAYRQHGNNAWAANPHHSRADVFFMRQFALHRMWREFEARAGFDARLMKQAYLEFT